MDDALANADETLGAAATRTSPWAAASLLFGIAVCCPVMTIIGVLAGARALIQIKADPRLRGKGMAMTGIAIGLLATAGWGVGAAWWHYHARLPMMRGPAEELRAGLAGDVNVFKLGFAGIHGSSSDDEARRFLAELTSRYGRFIDSEPRPGTAGDSHKASPSDLRIPYTFTFERGPVEVHALFITFGPSRAIPDPVFKWGWIHIVDVQRGDLVYPVSAEADALDGAARPASP